MSTSGQGDQINGINKDDEPEISSTTSENEGLMEIVGKSNENSSAATAIDPEDRETSKAVRTVASDLPSSSFDEKPVTDAVIASTTAEIQENLDVMNEGSKLRLDTGCELENTEVSHLKAVVSEISPETGSSDFTKETGIENWKPGILKDIPEPEQAETDKDGSIGDNLELRWDDSDNEADGPTEPIHTYNVLEMLDKEIGEGDTFKNISEKETIKSVKDTKTEEKDVINALTTNVSFEESHKIITEIDSLIQDDEMDKTSENPVTADKVVNQFERNEMPKDAVALEKPYIEESKQQTAVIEVSIKPLVTANEVMDVDDTVDIIKNESIEVAISTHDSFEESQKIIGKIDSLTQYDEINKTTILPAGSDKPITFKETDKLLKTVEMPIDEFDSENPDIEKSKPETIPIKIPLKSFPKDEEKMDVDDSGDIIQEKEITEEKAVTASDLYEESQKTVQVLDSLTQDVLDETTELPSVTVDELDKTLEDVEIPKDELIEYEKSNTDLVPKTVSIEIPFKPLTKDGEEMDVDKSGENKKGEEIIKVTTTASVSFEECQTTITENDRSNQDDKIKKAAELKAAESDNPVAIDELDKQFDDVEILKNELDESEKSNIEEHKPHQVPSNLLSKDNEVTDLDDSNDIDKDTSTVDDFTAEVTKIQDNTLDSVQKEKDESINDQVVLDKTEDNQDTSNITHDIIAEVLKPAVNVTSEYDISTADKTILKSFDLQMIPVKDEQYKTKKIEDISEISLPVEDKNKEKDDIDTIQDLNDKLSRVQNIENKYNNDQKIEDTGSSVQDNKKSSDEQNISLKSYESQAVDDKVTSRQLIDEKTLEAENILVNNDTEDKLGENASILDDSLIDTTISPNKHHRINKPNVMLDIPTQDLSDIEAELSDSEMNDDIEKPLENTDNFEKSKMYEKQTEFNKIVKVIPEISRISTPTIEIDATTSKLNITTVSPLKLKQSSLTDVKIDDKSSTKTQDILMKNDDDENVAEKSSQGIEKSVDDKPSSSRQVDDQRLDEQPCCSKDIGNDTLENLASDDADDMQESDSLGLLAESSRVMDDDIDDDEEPEDLEPDDNDEDEDFDPYEESNSQTLEDLDTDESNPPTEEKADETEVIDADQQTVKQKEIQPVKIKNILEKVLSSLTDLKQQSVPSGSVLNYVEVEGSSDSDDVEEISKPDTKDLISVKVPAEVDVMLTSGAEGGTSAMHSNKDEVVISVPKPHSLKVAKINTSEVTIKSASKNLETIQIPETTTLSGKKSKDEVFNIDSDDEEEKIEGLPKEDEKENSPELPIPAKSRKCINPHCTSTSGEYSKASRATIAYYTLTRRSGAACRECKEKASERSQALVNGIKDLRPLLALDMEAPSHQLVEISDSDEDEEPVDESEKIGEKGAKFILDNLVDVFNEVWVEYEMDTRLKHTETCLMTELERLEAGAKELDAMLDECQMKTDAIRTDFYKDYEPKRRHVGGIVIHDTPFSSYSHTEKDIESVLEVPTNRYPKRRSASNLSDPPAKKQAVSVESQDKDKQAPDQSKMEEDKDISVVKLSAESAPASLPPHGELVRPALHAGMSIYAMRNAFGTWNKAKILDIVQEATPTQAFTQCKVKFEHKVKNSCKVLAARCLAYCDPCEVRYTIGTRVIALFKDPHSTRLDAYYAGVVAEVPNPVNNYRYLVFFDDGYAQYIQHADMRLVCQASSLVWEEVHPFIHDFVKNYLKSYPERPMVRLRKGETLNTEWNGKWWSSRVLEVDASIALIHFDQDDRTEWIYRGSTRLEPLYLELQAAKAGGRSRLRLPRTKQIRSNMPCVEYTRSDEQANAKAAAEAQAQQRQAEELRRQRAVAKKSTTDRQSNQQQTAIQGTPFEGVISRVVYYTPKNAVKPARMVPHTCNPSCGKRTELLTLQDLRTYNPLAKPLLSGWERQTVRYKGHREVVYRAPCGRRLRNMVELHRYLCMLQSDLSVDLFDFTAGTHCLAEFVLNKCIVGKKDLSHGKENVPVPCVNYYDDSLPEFCSYNTERTPTAGVPLNIDPDFLCGCDCTDDCQDKSKCACWKMTLEGARTIGLEGDNIGYVYRRLPEPLPSGIYECNSRCKCKQTCLNRVAQHPLQLKLQVFKTMNRGWGIRALNDVPKGAFLCVYAGNLLTDATANLDGLNEGDEYLAELDYIEVVEGMKEGYEDDIPEKDKDLDKKGSTHASESESQSSSESEEEKDRSGKDHDFQPNAYIPQPQGGVYFQKSLRKREKAKKKEVEKAKQKEQEVAKKRDDCITISDDEEVREPSRFTADDIADKDRKHSSRVSVRTLFGKDEACYIMDAKVQGNIGRYLNHSCHPNVFVQNVFVDTHDPRFPWVAFFALAHVRAGNELTWNYNYDVGSVPGKVLYCYCGAPNCRGRLL